MAKKSWLSKNTRDQLTQLGIPEDTLARAVIEVGTKKSRFITRLFHSKATVIGRTIYFKEKYYNPASMRGLALLAHEMVHVYQWKKDGVMFPVIYAFEYLRGLSQTLFAQIKGQDTVTNLAHAQVSYEMSANAMQKRVTEIMTRKLASREEKHLI